jgi:hypothetical protein
VDDGTRTHDDRNHNPGLYQLSYVHQNVSSSACRASGAPGRTRTCDPRLRRPVLYPAELRALLSSLPFTSTLSLEMVGAAGFEPATLCSQSRCATRLRHAPPEVPYVRVRSAPARDAEYYGSPLCASNQIYGFSYQNQAISNLNDGARSFLARHPQATRHAPTIHPEYDRTLSSPWTYGLRCAG